jgi:NAD(P)-dependent dehydrogenase (short-subunit alcohol dehydrogenase family)
MNTLGCLDDKVVVVTGASEGLGVAVARAAAEAGARVVVTARREALVKDVADSSEATDGTAVATVADIADDEGRHQIVKAALDAFGRIDVLVNNAGSAVSGPAESEPASSIDHVISTNLVAPYRLSQLIAADMLVRRTGSIVNVSSISALASFDRFGLGSYAASKAALQGLTRNWPPSGAGAACGSTLSHPAGFPAAPTATSGTNTCTHGSLHTPRSTGPATRRNSRTPWSSSPRTRAATSPDAFWSSTAGGRPTEPAKAPRDLPRRRAAPPDHGRGRLRLRRTGHPGGGEGEAPTDEAAAHDPGELTPCSAATTTDRVSHVRCGSSLCSVNQAPTWPARPSSHQQDVQTGLHPPVRVMSETRS